jgi:hypothetical protein
MSSSMKSRVVDAGRPVNCGSQCGWSLRSCEPMSQKRDVEHSASVVLGAGKMLSDFRLLRKISIDEERCRTP